MKPTFWSCLLLCGVIIQATGSEVERTVPCRIADPGLLAASWDARSAAFSPSPEGLRFDRLRGGLTPAAAHVAGSIRVDAEFTVSDGRPVRWAHAGVRIRGDDENYWQLALTQAPAGRTEGRFLELGERRSGIWPAHQQPGKVLKQTRSGDLTWMPERRYRLRLELGPGMVSGVMYRDDGVEQARITCELTTESFHGPGAAMLWVADCTGIVTDFSYVAEDPVEPVAAVPPRPYDLPVMAGGMSSQASGFFRVERHGGVWWTIDPLGRGIFLNGMNLSNGYRKGWISQRTPRGSYYPYEENTRSRYPNVAAWEQAQVARLREWNFNFSGLPGLIEVGWLGSEIDHFTNYAALIDDKKAWCGVPDVFDERWPVHCDLVARRCAARAQDPWLLGWYLGNELPWGQPDAMAVKTWLRPSGHAGRRRLAALAIAEAGSVAAFNRAWACSIVSFDDLERQGVQPRPETPEARAIASAFFAEAVERYFSSITAAVRRYDPNHLILGERFVGIPAAPVLAACGRHCDVISINDYPRSAVDPARGVDPAHLERLRAASDVARRPLLISEWSFPALDSGLPCLAGAGMRVMTQAQRAACYAYYAEMAASAPFIIGQQWFCLVDLPREGISDAYPEDCNYGFLNDRDEVYGVLAETAKRVNGQAASLHAAGRQAGLSPPQPRDWSVPAPDVTRPSAPAYPVDCRGWAVGWRPEQGWTLSSDAGPLGALGAMVKITDGRPSWMRAGPGVVTATGRNDAFQLFEVLWDVDGRHAIGDHTRADQPPVRELGLRIRYWFPTDPGCQGGWVAVQPIEVVNRSRVAVQVDAVYTVLDPGIGGDPADDRRSLASPCMGFESWEDAGRAFGAWLPGGGTTMLWRESDGTPHSDIAQPVAVTLEPGGAHPLAGHLAIVAWFSTADLAACERRLRAVRQESGRWLR